MFERKYYKFTDPLTGNPTKTVGFYYTRDLPRIEIRQILDGKGSSKLVTMRDELVTKVRKYAPKGGQEISKSEYDALDTSKESSEASAKRKYAETGLEKVAEYYEKIKDAVPRRSDFHIKALKVKTGIDIAIGEEAAILKAKAIVEDKKTAKARAA